MRIVVFTGPKTSGKDTAAQYLIARNSVLRGNLFRQVNFGDALKGSVQLIFGFTQKELYDPTLKEVVVDRWPFKSPREIMQNFAQLCRTFYDASIWVHAWRRKIALIEAACIVVTDLRHPEELEELRKLDAKIIYVENPKVEAERAKGIAEGNPLWTDYSEKFAELMRKESDYILVNEGVSLDTLYTEVQKAMDTLFGDWKEWEALTRIDGGLQG